MEDLECTMNNGDKVTYIIKRHPFCVYCKYWGYDKSINIIITQNKRNQI